MNISVNLGARASQHSLLLHGASVEYWDYAPVQTTAQTRTILVVHGFRGDHHGLERVVEALPQMRVIMPDLPGFGLSAALPKDPHDVERYGRFVLELIEALQLGPDTVLLGHSFGSIVASHFAAGHTRQDRRTDPGQSDCRTGPGGAQGRTVQTGRVLLPCVCEASGQGSATPCCAAGSLCT